MHVCHSAYQDGKTYWPLPPALHDIVCVYVCVCGCAYSTHLSMTFMHACVHNVSLLMHNIIRYYATISNFSVIS
jgi:hypothetical protein